MAQVIKGPIKFIRRGKYPFCHSVIVEDRLRAVIDASSDERELQDFTMRGAVRYLITSHAHEDHIIYNYLFPQSTFCLHAFDAPQFADVDNLIRSFGETEPDRMEKWRAFLLNDLHYQVRKPDLFLQDGLVLDLGGVQVEVVHTPGHTRGHCAFYFPNEKILFTADLDLVKSGPFYGDPTSSIEETIRSLERLKTYKAETYLTAHGKGILVGDPAHIDRYMGMIFTREEKVADYLQKGPRTLDEIVHEGLIYGQKTISIGPWELAHSERMMILKHLERLISANRVYRDGDFYVFKK